MSSKLESPSELLPPSGGEPTSVPGVHSFPIFFKTILPFSSLSLFLFYDASSDSPSEAQIQNFQNLRHCRSSPRCPIAPTHRPSHPHRLPSLVRSGQEPTINIYLYFI